LRELKDPMAEDDSNVSSLFAITSMSKLHID
jgi:hypothetical protein